MVAVVVPRQHEEKPVFVSVPRSVALPLAVRAAARLERELASTEQAMLDKELARRERWNRRWWVRLLPFLKADASREAIDVWDTGGGDVLARLDEVFQLSWLEHQAKEARRVAAAAKSSAAASLPIEKRLYDVLQHWARQ